MFWSKASDTSSNTTAGSVASRTIGGWFPRSLIKPVVRVPALGSAA